MHRIVFIWMPHFNKVNDNTDYHAIVDIVAVVVPCGHVLNIDMCN